MNREPDEMEYVLVGLLIWFTLAGLGGLIALFMYNEHPWVLIARFPQDVVNDFICWGNELCRRLLG